MQNALDEHPPGELTSLSSVEPQNTPYGATSDDDDDGDDSHIQSSYEGDYLLDSDWAAEDEDRTDSTTGTRRLWQWLKNAVRIIANVENLWDESPSSNHTMTHRQRRRNQSIVLFWFFVLAFSYTTERSTFKLLVDTTGPFRLLCVLMVTATHALMLGLIMLVGNVLGHRHSVQSLGIPVVDVGLMALLDTVTILLVFVTGLRVPPTLTVILVQFILPLTAILTQFVHPDGYCTLCQHPHQQQQPHDAEDREEGNDNPGEVAANRSRSSSSPPGDSSALPRFGGLSREHVWGSLIIFVAVLLALIPAWYSLADPDFFVYADAIPIRTAINTLVYASSCFPAAASQLYKEHIFTQLKQPVNMDYLNLLLSIFQFVFVSIMSPLVFSLQGLGAQGDWTELYPSADFSQNFVDGLECFFGILSKEDQDNKYPEFAECRYTLVLVVFHALAIILVGVAVDKIINAGATKIMYRGVSAGIIASVLCMNVYDMKTPDFNYGPLVDGLNLICLVLLILGSEVYHRVSLQESTFETVYPRVDMGYEDG